MEINLKNAHKLILDLNAYISTEINLTKRFEVSMFDKHYDSNILKQRDIFEAKLKLNEKILLAISDLREMVSQKNHSSGISRELGNLNKYQRLANLFATTPGDVGLPKSNIDARIIRLVGSDSNSYEPTSFQVGILTKDDIENLENTEKSYKKEIKNTKNLIDELNYVTKISIPDDIVKLLKEIDFI